MLYDQEFIYLTKMIESIYNRHSYYAKEFEAKQQNRINLKKQCVYKFLNESSLKVENNLLHYIQDFKGLIGFETTSLLFEEEVFLATDRRIKNDKSIYNKLLKFQKKNGFGRFPIIKCLNDILGYRFIFKNEVELKVLLNDINSYVEKNFKDNIKQFNIMDASKYEYKAIHIYFKSNNFTFPCELQVWLMKDQQMNEKSHRKYKQDYLNWDLYENNSLQKRGD